MPKSHFAGFVSSASSGCSTTGLTDSDRQLITNIHNNFRSSLANGKERTASGGNAPKAKNMYKLVRDCSMKKMSFSNMIVISSRWLKVGLIVAFFNIRMGMLGKICTCKRTTSPFVGFRRLYDRKSIFWSLSHFLTLKIDFF